MAFRPQWTRLISISSKNVAPCINDMSGPTFGLWKIDACTPQLGFIVLRVRHLTYGSHLRHSASSEIDRFTSTGGSMPTIRHFVAGAALSCTTGCYTSHPVTLNENPSASTRPTVIEITSRDGTRFTVHSPMVRGDSLYGWLDDTKRAPAAFALTNSTSARSRRFNGERTAAAFIGGGVLLLLLWASGLGMAFGP